MTLQNESTRRTVHASGISPISVCLNRVWPMPLVSRSWSSPSFTCRVCSMTAWVAWMASSTEERMAAIFFCSGRGGTGTLILEKAANFRLQVSDTSPWESARNFRTRGGNLRR